MEKIEKRIIEDIKMKGVHTNTPPDDGGKVELYWCISTDKGVKIDIYFNRFEIVVPDIEGDDFELVIHLKGYYKNMYALSSDPDAADKAFEAAHGLIKTINQITYNALR